MKTEKVIAVILVVGLILKFSHIPGGNILTILSLTTLSFLYFPLGFYFLSDKKIENKTAGFSVLSGLAISILVIGNLFKLMHWPGAMFMIIIGLLSCLPISIVSYLKFNKPQNSEHANYYRNIFIRVMVFMILGLLRFIF